MADPSIQTFCCQRPLNYHSSFKLMGEFNSERFNMVCLLSSLIGLSGAVYQILPKNEPKVPNRFYSNIMRRGKIIVMWLALADFFASFGIFLRSCLKLMHNYQWYDEQPYTFACISLAVWIQYFYMVTWLWTLFYAVDMWRAYQDRDPCRKLYHFFAWIFPAVFTFIGLSNLYSPNANCHNLSFKDNVFMKFLPNYFLTFLPIVIVMVVNPILYWISVGYIYHIITSYMAQYSTNERKMLDLFKQRFALINLGFYVCWMPNLISAVLVWTTWDNLPTGAMLILWYLMAVLNPMQAFFNSFLYNMLEHTEQIFRSCFRPQNKIDEMVERWPLLIANEKGSSNSNGYELIE